MTVKQTLRWIFGGIVAFLFAILGIQRKKIVKQKEEIKEAKEEVKQAEAQAEQAVKVVQVVKEAAKTEQAIQAEQTANEQVIQEAENDEEILDFATALIDNFNNKL